jgi:hypothetical protein
METRTELTKTELANGPTVSIQATALGGEEEVAFSITSFQVATDEIETHCGIDCYHLVIGQV